MPKILIWDIETAGVNALRSDLGVIVNFGYKWLDAPDTRVITIDQFPGWFDPAKGGLNDYGLLCAASEIFNEADLLVAHYGDKFDRRFLQGRLAIHNLPAPAPTKQRDTCLLARKAFNFSSNRLENLAKVLGLKEQKQQKKGRDQWPGWWHQVLAGYVPAIRAMAEYCAQDVRTTEELYLRIRAYDYVHPRVYDDRSTCGVCGGGVQYRGVARKGIYRYRRFQCVQCGKWGTETRRAR